MRHLERALRREPTSFGFFQAVRLLERRRRDRAPVGHYADPADEVVRFSVNPAISFPPSEIHRLELPTEGPARMSVNFLGLTGPQSVLPYHYSLLVAERLRARDGALASFLDLFHHRMLSLFYRAWERHQVAVAYEKGEDPLRAHLLDLVGMGLESQQELLDVPDDVLAFYTGLLGPQPRSALALEQLLAAFFEVPVEIQQFVGGWYPLAKEDQCAVGAELGASTQLGLGAVVGDEIWDHQMRVRIRLGPLNRTQFDGFLPTGSAHEPLRALVRFFSHDQFDFEIQLVLARDDVPGCVLGTGEQPLGWGTWIRTTGLARDADETILSL
ncbi:MAG: type VI secretion system baseplate subunit TssG [Gemmatimonadetes bacterium]|nr:type VI secretion system baseplate subunit TssG [Gemmatimonadota bacterium]